jgi:hypothetical protein
VKSYPLDIQYFDGWVWSKGHHDIVTFGSTVHEGYGENIATHTFRQRYARAVPVPGSDMGLVYCDGPGRGAFPVTEAEVGR